MYELEDLYNFLGKEIVTIGIGKYVFILNTSACKSVCMYKILSVSLNHIAALEDSDFINI